MKYLAVFEKAPRNYSAYIPDLPGIGVTGTTIEETRSNLQKALAWHLEAMRADNEPIPEPSTWAEVMEASEPVH